MTRQEIFEKMMAMPEKEKDEILMHAFDVIENGVPQDELTMFYDYIKVKEVR